MSMTELPPRKRGGRSADDAPPLAERSTAGAGHGPWHRIQEAPVTRQPGDRAGPTEEAADRGVRTARMQPRRGACPSSPLSHWRMNPRCSTG